MMFPPDSTISLQSPVEEPRGALPKFHRPMTTKRNTGTLEMEKGDAVHVRTDWGVEDRVDGERVRIHPSRLSGNFAIDLW